MQTDRMLQAGNRWRSPIHMPKAAARLWLQVKSVRVERLQAITEGDAEAEGCSAGRAFDPLVGEADGHTAVDNFAGLWHSIYGDHPEKGWEADPWVWVIDFTRKEPDRVE